MMYFPKLIMLLLLKTTYLLDSVTSSILFKDEKGVVFIYFSLYLKDIADTVFLRPVWGL